MLLQHLPNLGVRIVQIAKDDRLGVATGLHTGRLQTDTGAFGAKVAFFHDTPGPGREILIHGGVIQERPRITPVKAAAAIGASCHTKTAADAAVEVHNDNAVCVAEGGLGGTDPHTGRIVAVVTEDRQLKFHIGLVKV